MTKKLNAKQLQAAKEYLIDLNQTKALERAGYSKKTAKQQACRLFTNVYFQEEIQRLMEKRSKRTEITIDRVLQELARLAFLDPAKMYDENGFMLDIKDMPEDIRRAVAGITINTTSNRDGSRDYENKTIKLIDKKGSLELLGRHLAMFVDRVKLEDDREDFDGSNPEKYVRNEISKKSKG